MLKPNLGGFRRLAIPVVIVSVLFLGFAAFYLYWVPDRQRHLDDRGFRYLRTLSDQIRLTINNYDKMLDNAVDAGITNSILPNYVANVAPQLNVPDCSEIAHTTGGDYDDPPRIAVEADQGTHFLYLAFQRDPKFGGSSIQYAVRTDLDKMINRLLGPSELSPFDVVLLSRGDGKVIFQKSLSTIEVAEIRNLEDVSGKATGKDQKPIDVSMLIPASQLEEVRIAGARYRFYSQPLQIGLAPARPDGRAVKLDRNRGCKSDEPKEKDQVSKPKGKASNDTGSLDDSSGPMSGEAAVDTWVLCGLVRSDRFRSESQLIPYSYILATLAVILLAAVSYPFLKLYLSVPGERLRARNVSIGAVFTCFIAAVVTFIIADVYFWTRYFDRATKGEMETLAQTVNANFERERTAAFAQLERLNAAPHSAKEVCSINAKLRNLSRSNVSLLYDKEGRCDPGDACALNILKDEKYKSDLNIYPYLLFAFWSDSSGNQRIKWTTRRHATPFIPLDDSSAPYYPDVRLALKDFGNTSAIPRQGVGSQYSPTTGQNITIFWEVIAPGNVPENCLDGPGDGKSPMPGVEGVRVLAAVVTQPVSLFNAVLPGGYQFAVLTPDGTVVFHSDATRNLRENFLAETDLNFSLHSRIRMRTRGSVTANYIGRPHRMYVYPMASGNQDGPWTLVIFRDLHSEEVMNLEILGFVALLLLAYFAIIGLIILAVQMSADKKSLPWFWLDSRKSGVYWRAASVSLASATVLVLLSLYLSNLLVLLFAVLLPAAAVLFNILSLRRDPPDDQSATGFRQAYFIAIAALVVVISVAPCLCFFEVAANFEGRLFTEHNLLKLATDVDLRSRVIRERYQDVLMTDCFHDRVLAGPEVRGATSPRECDSTPDQTPVSAYNQFLGITISTAQSWCPSPPSLESRFFSFISYPYNERAADDRHLAEGESDVETWTSKMVGADHVIELSKHEPAGEARVFDSIYLPFHFRWNDYIWLLLIVPCLGGIYWLVRLTLTRVFLLHLVGPPAVQQSTDDFDPARLIADLPMNLLLIGPESGRPIGSLLQRSDVQIYEADVLLQIAAAPALGSPLDKIIRNGRATVLRNFERLPDDPNTAASTHAGLVRLLSTFSNSVILITSLDPILISSIESSDRWRNLLRSFVRIDLNTKPPQRVGESQAEYQYRVSAESYFHWLFAALPPLKKLVMLQLAQEKLANPNSDESMEELMEEGMIERRHGLLAVSNDAFELFLQHALPQRTISKWEKEIAGLHPFPLQSSLMIIGVGVVAFLIYTQGDVFNTWVTYATGVAAAVPKVLQFLDNFRSKTTATT